jgi:hypothetical protein
MPASSPSTLIGQGDGCGQGEAPDVPAERLEQTGR